MPKQYKLLHLGTGEQVFGIHSKAWFVERFRKYSFYYRSDLPENHHARWQLYSKSYRLFSLESMTLCDPIEFALFEVKNEK